MPIQKNVNNGRDGSFSHLEVWRINFQLHDREDTHAKKYSRKNPLRNSLSKRE